MRLTIKGYTFRLICVLLALSLLAGCGARRAYNKGEEAMVEESYDAAVAYFLDAVERSPDNNEYQMKLKYARMHAAQKHKLWGDKFLAGGKYLKALEEYQLALDLDGSYYAADEGLKHAVEFLQAQKLVAEAESLLKARRRKPAKAALNKALSLVPNFEPAEKLLEEVKAAQYTTIDGVELEVTSDEPINLNFREAKLPDVFDILTKLSGINFILDEDVRGNNTTLFLEHATFAQALELLLRMNKLDKKILNSKTILLFPKTRDKQKQFEDQLIQTFYLSNIDAKKAVNLIRTMLQVRKIYVHEELNAIVIRDSPQVIKLAQKIIEASDRADSEVVFDLELIEVNHSDTRELGLKLSNYSVAAGLGREVTSTNADGVTSTAATIISNSLSAGDSAAGLIAGVDGFKDLTPFYAIPTATFRLMKTQVDAEVLASPKIRVKNKEKAKVHIGSREPVITVTINGDQTSENVQYVDVGVKLDVEPVIQLDNTIVTKLGLEVSNVSGRERTSNGTAVLTISTTNANTALTLKDGEQTIIGGLLRDDRSVTKNKIPFLGDIPLIGELFNGTDKNNSKREILLSITPHIVKTVQLPETDVASIWSGGEDDLSYGRNFGSFAEDYKTAQDPGIVTQTNYIPEPRVSIDSYRQPPTDEVDEEAPEPETSVEPPATEALEASPVAPPVTEPLTPPERSFEPAPAVPPTPTPAAPPIPVGEPMSATEPPATLEAPLAEAPAEEESQVAEVVIQPAKTPEPVTKPKVFIQSAQLVQLGETFTISVQVSEIEDLFSAPLYIQYDTSLFEFLGAAEGDFLQQGVSPTVFTHTALEGTGRIIVGLKQGAGGKGISGGGQLFTMKFQAVGVGQGEIRPTRTNFRNPRGERLRVDSTGVMIEVVQ